MKNLFVWNANIKNAYRQQIRVILEKLDKKCGSVVLICLIVSSYLFQKFSTKLFTAIAYSKIPPLVSQCIIDIFIFAFT